MPEQKLGTAIKVERISRGLTQAELGARVGLSVAGVSKVESGATKQPRNLALILDALGLPAQKEREKAKLPSRRGFQKIKLFSHACAKDPNKVLLAGALDYEDMPAMLRNSPGAYMVLVHGDSMSPRYEPGDVCGVDPTRAVNVGRYAVVQVADTDDGPAAFAYIGVYLGVSDGAVIIQQLNPTAFMQFPAARVRGVHLIVGAHIG